MRRFLVRRLLLTVPVPLGVATLVFSLIHLVPGDPVQAMLGDSASPQDMAELRGRLGCKVGVEVDAMGTVQVELDQDLIAVLEELHRPVREAAHELIVLELYRQGDISGGKAAQLLGMRRDEFIRHASERGIPYLQLSGEELRREIEDSQSL